MAVILAVISSLAVWHFTFKWFFEDSSDWVESIKYWLTPDIIAIFRGEWDREIWAEMRLFFWLLLGGLCGYAVYRFLLS